MDVRTADVEPTVEHGGTVRSYFMFHKDELREATLGSFLELVAEFEVSPGEQLEPHRHNTHEFYYILNGRGMMQIEAEQREVGPGDLIHIPPRSVHSVWPIVEGQPLRAFAFAVSFQEPGTQWVTAPLPA